MSKKKDEIMLEVMENMELYFPEDCRVPKKIGDISKHTSCR